MSPVTGQRLSGIYNLCCGASDTNKTIGKYLENTESNSNIKQGLWERMLIICSSIYFSLLGDKVREGALGPTT